MTLIIPSHNRHKKLKRSIKFYTNKNIKVIYLDSSEFPLDFQNTTEISYYHLPKLAFVEKIIFGLGIAASEFVSFCADDDLKCINDLRNEQQVLLKSNSDIVIGNTLYFQESFNENIYGSIIVKEGSYSHLNISELFWAGSCAPQILWSSFRRKSILEAFEQIKLANYTNQNFYELHLWVYFLMNSNHRIYLSGIQTYRELSNGIHWGERHRKISLIRIFQQFLDYKSLLKNFVIFQKFIVLIFLGIYLVADAYRSAFHMICVFFSEGRVRYTRLKVYSGKIPDCIWIYLKKK